MTIEIKKLHPDAVIPKYATPGSSGADLYAVEDVEIFPVDTKLVKTGLAMKIPVGFEAQVRSRSGLALKKSVHVLNSPGTIDSDYRGEVGVILHNASDDLFQVKKGDRIAQLVVAPVATAAETAFKTVDELDDTDRGEGGFGSTGTN